MIRNWISIFLGTTTAMDAAAMATITAIRVIATNTQTTVTVASMSVATPQG